MRGELTAGCVCVCVCWGVAVEPAVSAGAGQVAPEPAEGPPVTAVNNG